MTNSSVAILDRMNQILMAIVPAWFVSLLCRVAVATPFWRSVQTKISGWEFFGQSWKFWDLSASTFMLFDNEYTVPLLPTDVAAYLASDSAYGCRQMIGNVWEWTASDFYPFPGYLVDHPYREYSAPWFGYHKVLKGGAGLTRSRLINNSYRNFFLPDRADVLAGFRTCAR